MVFVIISNNSTSKNIFYCSDPFFFGFNVFIMLSEYANNIIFCTIVPLYYSIFDVVNMERNT